MPRRNTCGPQGDRRPIIVFFFGGGFTGGDPSQFTTKAEYFASRGMVAASTEYRIRSKHETGREESIEDAKSAVRWVRMNAGRLGSDPGRVVASGGSSGGTCAAYAALNTTCNPTDEDMAVSSKPDALVLFFPSIGYPNGLPTYTPEQLATMKSWGPFFSDWKVTKGAPPTIVFVGTEDQWSGPIPVFVQQLIAAGNRAELYTAKGQKHGFSSDRPGSPWHALVLRQTDIFLASLGYLKGQPTIAVRADTKDALQRELP